MVFKFQRTRKVVFTKLFSFALALTVASAGLMPVSGYAENDDARLKRWKSSKNGALKKSQESLAAPVAIGKSTTVTEVVVSQTARPALHQESSGEIIVAEARYAQIVAAGGWPQLPRGTYRKGSKSKNAETLKQRLLIEGYLTSATVQETGYGPATQEAVMRYQRNNGLVASGVVDGPTLTAFNVSADSRLGTIRANIARVQEYSKNIGLRYVLVNVPAQQIETVENGRVYSRHNAVMGRQERPTPVVMTAVSDVAFNPYWNAPASIVERDLLPKIKGGDGAILQKMNIHVFKGVGGPEVDPATIDWDTIVVDEYHFRQEPGPQSAMASAKINFPSPFGIYLHDTPEKHLFNIGGRFFSSGCVRVDKMSVLINWVLNGQDGYNPERIEGMKESLERLDVKLITPPQLRVAYLTAWPVGDGLMAFRQDVYQLDGTGFVTGQPMPVGETAPDGQRFVLKPLPRQAAAVEEAEAEGFSWFGGRTKRPDTVPVSASERNVAGSVALVDPDPQKGKVIVKEGRLDEQKRAGGFFARSPRDTVSHSPAQKTVTKTTVTTATVVKKNGVETIQKKTIKEKTITPEKNGKAMVTDVKKTTVKDVRNGKTIAQETVVQVKTKNVTAHGNAACKAGVDCKQVPAAKPLKKEAAKTGATALVPAKTNVSSQPAN